MKAAEKTVDLTGHGASQISQNKNAVASDDGNQQVQNRRRSERLIKDTHLSIKEKNERIAQKRNLEGNPVNANSFSVLPVEELISISCNMGIAIQNDAFDTFNLIRDLEKARNDLYLKQSENKQPSQTESVGNEPVENAPLELEWLHDESSETEDFILVESRKKRRESKKKVKISPEKKLKKQDQENSD